MNFFFLKIIWRSLTRRGVFSIINILGLSISLAVVLLMYLQIYHERSFDRSFKESNNIYRVNAYWSQFRTGETTAITPAGLSQIMKTDVPGVKEVVRVYNRGHVMKIGDYEEDVHPYWVDEDFFRLFDTPVIHGSLDEMLKRPDAFALSESKAKMLFGNRNPVGEIVLFGPSSMEICAVFKDFPVNSSFSGYTIIGSMNNTPVYNDPRAKNYVYFETWCLLEGSVDKTGVEEQLRRIASDDFKDQGYTFTLQELADIHLYSGHIANTYTTSQGDREQVSMLIMLAVIILLIACINYMNLATAKAQKRSKEIGISKTIGAKRLGLVGQLFFETGMLTTFSFVIGFGLAFLLLPVFNGLLNARLTFGLVFNVGFLFGALSIHILTTIVAASYPAFYMSGFPPLGALRAATHKGSKNALVRQILIVGQFVAAIVLISWVFVVYSQIQYINNKNIGYNINQLIGFWIRTARTLEAYEAFENDLRAQSSVLGVSRVGYFPTSDQQVLLRKDLNDEGANFTVCAADEHLIDLMQLQLIAGTSLPARVPGDTIAQIVLNRKAVEYLGSTPEDIIGKRIYAELRETVYVCGVVENFNYQNLYVPISEYGIHNGRMWGRFYLMARISSVDVAGQLQTYEKLFKQHYPNDMFDVHYPDLEMKSTYQGTQTTAQVALLFSGLAILIACMGVFGLTAFMAEQRIKEIGIRKVLGGSVGDIVALFTNQYVKLLLIALVIGIPIAWWIGHLYLQNFAYRIALSWWMFAAAALITIALTLLTVSFQAIKAATANPLDAIKTE